MNSGYFIKSVWLGQNAGAPIMSVHWDISDGQKILYKDVTFIKAGMLKHQNKVVLFKKMPATTDKSICFATIGYRVNASIDGKSFYNFGSFLASPEVWGVKVHICKIPDGIEGRELKLDFITNNPANIAVSKFVLLDDELAILKALMKSTMIRIIFALFYISIGIFILIFILIAIAFKFRKFNFSLLALAFIALFMGSGLLFNISLIAFFTGPKFVYWVVNITDMAIPIWTLIFVAADKNFEKSRLLVATAMIQGVILGGWALCNLYNLNLFPLYWRLPQFILLTTVLATTFIREFKTGAGRPVIATAVASIILLSLLDAYIYFTKGNYYTMDYNLNIMAFPVLVLMIGKTILDSAQSEYHIMNENMTLRIEGELLCNNYQKTEKYIEETKQIWHDIDKHLSIVHLLLNNGEYDELKRYLEFTGFAVKNAKQMYLCENRLINAILTDKISEVEHKDIVISISGNLPEKLEISGNDLCSLLVNMLDNAIEACEKIPPGGERRIELSLKIKQGFVYFEVFNTVDTAPVIKGETLVTSKEDKERHGYGLAIIRKIAEKYHGAFDTFPSEDSFMIKVALKNAPAGGMQQITGLKTGTV